MVIDTIMDIGHGRVAPKSPTRQRPTVVNAGGDSRQHEELVECRHRVNALNADLRAATVALASANDALAKANSENECLRRQIKGLNEENAKMAAALKAPVPVPAVAPPPSFEAERQALNEVITALTDENTKLKAEVERLSAKKSKKGKKGNGQPEQQATAGA